MAIHLERFIKGSRFTQEFDVNDTLDQIIPKVGPGSVIGTAIEQAVPIATDTVAGKVALNTGSNLPADANNIGDALTSAGANTILNDLTVAGGNPMQKAVVNAFEKAIGADDGAQVTIADAVKEEMAAAIAGDAPSMGVIINAIPVATDTFQGRVALNLGNTLPADTTNSVDALTASGFNAMANVVGTPNAVQQAITNAVENTIGSDAGAQLAIADAIKEEVAAAIAGDTASMNVLAGGFPVATDAVQGKVALNLGTSLPGDATNSVDALTASGVTTLLNDASLAGGNQLQQAVVNAVERSLVADVGAQAAIANAIKDDVASAIAGDPTSMASLAGGFPVATDTVLGKVALNLGTSLPGDTTNISDALTASGLNAMASATGAGTPNAVQSALTKAVGAGIASDLSTQTAIASAIKDDVASAIAGDAPSMGTLVAAIPSATDTVQGKVSLNLGNTLPADTGNATDALTAAGFNTMANATGTPNAIQQAITNAVETTISSDAGAQAAIANAIKDDLLADSTFTTGISTGFPVATDTVQGKVSLAVAANHPSASETEAATPAYVSAAIATAVPAASDGVAGRVALNTGTSVASDVINNTDALTAFGHNSMLNDTTISGGNAMQKAVVNAVEQAIAADAGAQAAVATALVDDLVDNLTVKAIGNKLVVQPGALVSADASNSIAVGTDGKLKVVIPAQLPDDQVLTGDPTGTVGVTLTPSTPDSNGQINYTLKSDLKVALTSPTSEVNLLKWSAAGFYVGSDEVASALAADTSAMAAFAGGFPVATDTVQGKVALNLGTNPPADTANATDALTASGAAALLNDTSMAGGNSLQQSVVNAVQQSIAADNGAQAAIASAIKDDIASAIAGDASSMGVLAGGFPVATDTVQGKVSLAVVGNYPSASETEAATPAYVSSAVNAAIAGAALSAATDTVQGKVALNMGTSLPSDTTNATDALTAAGFNTMANATGTPNAVQQAITNAVEQAIGGDAGAQAAIANAIKDDLLADSGFGAGIAGLVPAATDTVQGKVSLAVAANYPSASDVEAATPAYVTSAVSAAVSGAAIPVATDTVQGKVALNMGSQPTDPTNAVDALTAFGLNTMLNDTATVGGTALQKAVVNAVEQAIGADPGAQAAIVSALPVASDTVQGKVSLAIAANLPSASETEAATPAYVAAALAAMVDAFGS